MLDIFVERIKLYYNPKVQQNCIFFDWDMYRERKMSEGSGKQVVPNSAIQQFFVPNSVIQPFFVPNSADSNFMPNMKF